MIPTLKNNIFSPFGPYLALMRSSSTLSDLKAWLLVKLSIKTRNKINCNNCTEKLCILFLALENLVFCLFQPYSVVQAIEPESLIFGQTFQFKVELKLIRRIVQWTYVMLLMALENHIFFMFENKANQYKFENKSNFQPLFVWTRPYKRQIWPK